METEDPYNEIHVCLPDECIQFVKLVVVVIYVLPIHVYMVVRANSSRTARNSSANVQMDTVERNVKMVSN